MSIVNKMECDIFHDINPLYSGTPKMGTFTNSADPDEMHYSGWTVTMYFALDQCLQSDARQSHSLGSDWIVKYITRQERNAYLAVFYMSK